MQLWGYVAHPSQSRSSAKGQFLFIGGRYVRDRSLSHALNEAYRGLLMVGRMPVAFLHLEIPPSEVDVNVHPTKIEVRFRDSHRVYSHLLSTLRQTFLKSDLHSRLQAAQEPAQRGIGERRRGCRGDGSCRAGTGPRHGSSDRGAASAGSSWTAIRPTGRRWPPGSSRAERRPVIPESVGQPVPPAWAQSLPLAFPTGPGEAFDEFSSGARGRGTARRPATGAPVDSFADPTKRSRASVSRQVPAEEHFHAPDRLFVRADRSRRAVRSIGRLLRQGREFASRIQRCSRPFKFMIAI